MTSNGRQREGSGCVPIEVDPALLLRWALPRPDDAADKEQRGRVLIVGGGPETPGAALLAATAALRAGAGKLRIATCCSIATPLAIAVQEARVIGLPETPAGGIDPSGAERLAELASNCQATLIGPGMMDHEAVRELVDRLRTGLRETTLVL